MTELEWLHGVRPLLMFSTYHKWKYINTTRKLRLLAVACARLMSHVDPDDLYNWNNDKEKHFENIEALADGLKIVHEKLTTQTWLNDDNSAFVAVKMLENVLYYQSQTYIAQILRDIIGNPFGKRYLFVTFKEIRGRHHFLKQNNTYVSYKDVMHRAVLLDRVWLTPQVLTLAEVIYHNRIGYEDLASCHLDDVGLCALADSLEEAGCDNRVILTDLRTQRPRMRGYHLLDLILDKDHSE